MTASVAIILCYFNGHSFIREQLDSLLAQTHQNFTVFVFDDNSSAEASKVLYEFEKNFGSRLKIKKRTTNLGFAENFLAGLGEVSLGFDYFCFCDQDDIWDKEKIERSIHALSNFPTNQPLLYASVSTLVGQDGKTKIGKNKETEITPSFRHSLLQNIGGGHSMMMNAHARNVVVKLKAENKVTFHDWWTYIVITGVGGKVIYDRRSSLSYRQHNGNNVGGKYGIYPFFQRFICALRGDYQLWTDKHIDLLRSEEAPLTPENRQILEEFVLLKNANLFRRVASFFRGEFRRSSFLENIALFLLVILKKL